MTEPVVRMERHRTVGRRAAVRCPLRRGITLIAGAARTKEEDSHPLFSPTVIRRCLFFKLASMSIAASDYAVPAPLTRRVSTTSPSQSSSERSLRSPFTKATPAVSRIAEKGPPLIVESGPPLEINLWDPILG